MPGPGRVYLVPGGAVPGWGGVSGPGGRYLVLGAVPGPGGGVPGPGGCTWSGTAPP